MLSLVQLLLADPEVTIEIIKEGTGENYPQKGQKVTVHYVGQLLNGKVFDSSRDRNQPFSFTLGTGMVIRGWDIAVAKMKLGEIAKVTIPYQLAYGTIGVPPTIQGSSDLIFEIELLDFADK